MSQVFLSCSECGQPIPVEQELLLNAIALNGVPPEVRHEPGCPGETVPVEGEAPVMRRFGIHFTLFEVSTDVELGDLGRELVVVHRRDGQPEYDVDPLSSMGHVVEAKTFATAVNGPFTDFLNKTWPRLQETAVIADSG